MAISSPAPARTQARRIKRAQGFVDEVYDLIRADIMALRIPPDTRISIDSLARQIGVSQTPIREALSRLEATGLVIKQHFVGYCSAPQLNRKQLDELYELRLLLEPYAARCAAERMSEEQLLAVTDPRHEDGTRQFAHFLRPLRRTGFGAARPDRGQQRQSADPRSGNLLIRDALAKLHTHLHIFRLRFHSEVTKEAFTKEAYSEHGELMAAFANRKPEQAAEAMRKHIEKSYQRLKAYTLE